MSDAEPRVFCAPWFKPVIVVTVLAVVLAVAWTIGGHSRPNTGCGNPDGLNTPILAATAPPIVAGQAAPHPNFGPCTRCHSVRGAGGAPAAPGGAIPAATAPPIAENAKLTHPSWGPCKQCHKLLPPTGAKTVAFTGTLGARVDTLTPKKADLLEMEGVKSPVVTQVVDGTPAAIAGLKVDDAILQVDNQPIVSAEELRTALGAAKPGAKVKLQIQRGERKKNIFIKLPAGPVTLVAVVGVPDGPGGALLPLAAPVAGGPAAGLAPALPPTPALAPSPYLWRVAIAATAPSREAQVAPVFSSAPYFLLRDGPDGPWGLLANPNPGGAGRGQSTARLLTSQGVGVVIAGNIGPGAFAALRGAGLQIYTGAFGSIEQVYAGYRRGFLIPATSTITASPSPPNLSGVLAIAAAGPGLSAGVAPGFSVAPYIVLYGLANGTAQVLTNPAATGRPSSEVQLAQLLVDRGASALIAGNLQPTTLQALAQLQVMGFAGVTGTVTDAISMYVQGRLRAATLLAPGAGAPLGPVLPPG
jgi:predicted Fe-Mo cluster-binding NifX family protein